MGARNDNSNDASDRSASTSTATSASASASDPSDSYDHADEYYYLTAEGAAALSNYQYSGTDKSLIYQYILSPLAGFLVDHCTPKSLAPNAITLTGLLFMIVAYSLIGYHCPSLSECTPGNDIENVIPRWIFTFNGIAMLVYQTLDNMDGKQARKTKSSSPLGLLFDHGIDAINSIFGSANWICAMGLPITSSSWQICVTLLSPMFTFYVATWEEYHTGELVLPPFNGPSEGLLIGASLSLITGMYGQQFWHGTGMYDMLYSNVVKGLFASSKLLQYLPLEGELRNYDLVLITSLVASLREILEKVITVIRKEKSSTKRIFQAMSKLLPMTILTMGIVQIVYSTEFFTANPRTCLHLFSIIFVEIVTSLMLDHVTESPYNPYRIILLPIVILGLSLSYENTALLNVIVGVQQEESGSTSNSGAGLFLWAYTSGAIVYLSLKMKIVVHEICCVLGIWCFDIVTPHPKKIKKEKLN